MGTKMKNSTPPPQDSVFRIVGCPHLRACNLVMCRAWQPRCEHRAKNGVCRLLNQTNVPQAVSSSSMLIELQSHTRQPGAGCVGMACSAFDALSADRPSAQSTRRLCALL